MATSLSDLSGSLATELTGNPQLFITRVPHPVYHYDELYVNNALIDRDDSNWNGTNGVGQVQVCFHIRYITVVPDLAIFHFKTRLINR